MRNPIVLALLLPLLILPAAAHDVSRAPSKPTRVLPPETLQTIDLGKEIPKLAGRKLRMRRVTLKPGGAIPVHSHADRPAVVYVLQGRLREHRSDREAPVEYSAGDTMIENAALQHWIENIGDKPLVGLVIDIPNTGKATAFTAEEILKAYGLRKHEHK